MLYDSIHHTDPEDCPYTEAEHRLDSRTGLCVGHAILPPPAPCRCTNDDAGPCPHRSRDRDEAPYCSDCYTTRVYGISGRDCTHEEPAA
jgi:hypothetical protein